MLWTAQVVLIDVTFLINTRPLRRARTILDYTTLLFNQVIFQYFKVGANEFLISLEDKNLILNYPSVINGTIRLNPSINTNTAILSQALSCHLDGKTM